MECNKGCAACCIYVSISSPIPGMPDGKPFGVRCVQLDRDNLCLLFGKPERPAVCLSLQPSDEMCGKDAGHSAEYLTMLEILTCPNDKTKIRAIEYVKKIS
ncbi:MAG: YkgJ family cysteine cluster protein [Clostridiales bacterium]|nr:YkgJ family cysteine cluster protein [Clostridiales bacterium]